MLDPSRDLDRVDTIIMDLVSHELRSPLAVIRGFAETLLRHVGQLPLDEQEEFLQAILQASHRLEHRLDQMIELAELQAGRVPRSYETIDLAHVALEVLETLGIQAHGHASVLAGTLAGVYAGVPVTVPKLEGGVLTGPTLVLEMVPYVLGGEDMPAGQTDGQVFLVVGDAQRLHGVLLHAIENALRHSPPGGVVNVQVRSASRERIFAETLARGVLRLDESLAAGNRERRSHRRKRYRTSLLDAPKLIEIAVSDAGPGIALDQLERIFEPFYQVDDDTRPLSRESEGLGLGLPICREVIRLHGGWIWAESAFGVGSCFRILLPQNDQESAPSAEMSRHRRHPRQQTRSK